MSFSTERFISADAHRVFGIITDFANYSEWNPCIIDVKPKKGEDFSVTVGKIFKVVCKWADGTLEDCKNKVISVDEPEEFSWREVSYPKWMVNSRSIRRIIPQEGGVIFRIEVLISGKMKSHAIATYGEKIRKHIEVEADALKAYAERKG